MDILLLHGAIGAAAQLAPLSQYFTEGNTIHLIDFTAHGNRPASNAQFSIGLFANDVLAYLDSHNIRKAAIFGYSMGGYVAVYLAKHHPDRIEKIITLATKYSWDEATAAKETQMLNPEKITQKLPAFAETLEQRHASNGWKTVLARTAAMMLEMGADNPLKQEDYATINHPTLIMLGDRDKMVTLEETVAVYKALPNAQLCILPKTAHPIEQVHVAQVANIALEFLGGE